MQLPPGTDVNPIEIKLTTLDRVAWVCLWYFNRGIESAFGIE